MGSPTRIWKPIDERKAPSEMSRLSSLLLIFPLLACLGTVDAVRIIRATPVDGEGQPYASCQFGLLGSTTGKMIYEVARPTGEGEQLEVVIHAGGGWRSLELKIRCDGSDAVVTKRVGWWRGSTVDLGTVVLHRSKE